MSLNLNQVIMGGRLATTPMLKSYENSKGEAGFRCFFKLAVTEEADLGKPRGEQRTNYMTIISWGAAAQRHAQYLVKGQEVIVVGSLVWESNKIEGTNKYQERVQIRASRIQYLRKPAKNQVDQPSATSAPIAGGKVTSDMVAQFEAFLAAKGIGAEGLEATAPIATPEVVGEEENPYLPTAGASPLA